MSSWLPTIPNSPSGGYLTFAQQALVEELDRIRHHMSTSSENWQEVAAGDAAFAIQDLEVAIAACRHRNNPEARARVLAAGRWLEQALQALQNVLER
jgi:hypothetical protein